MVNTLRVNSDLGRDCHPLAVHPNLYNNRRARSMWRRQASVHRCSGRVVVLPEFHSLRACFSENDDGFRQFTIRLRMFFVGQHGDAT